MVIYFKSRKALKHLLIHGFVYTLRSSYRKRYCRWIEDKQYYKCVVESVKTSRYSKSVAKAVVYMIGLVNINNRDELEKYVNHSGFSSVDEWINEYKRLNGNHPIAVLYKVKLLEEVIP